MDIQGNSKQEKEPSPTKPVEIKNDVIIVDVNGKKIPLDTSDFKKRFIDCIKIDGKWYARFQPKGSDK